MAITTVRQPIHQSYIPPAITYTMPEQQLVRRGDIFLADMSQSIGCEQAGIRYVLVIGNNTGNIKSPAVIVCSITSQEKTKLPTHVLIPLGNGMPKTSIIMLEQIRTVDKFRLLNHVTRLNSFYMEQVDKALKISVALFE